MKKVAVGQMIFLKTICFDVSDFKHKRKLCCKRSLEAFTSGNDSHLPKTILFTSQMHVNTCVYRCFSISKIPNSELFFFSMLMKYIYIYVWLPFT